MGFKIGHDSFDVCRAVYMTKVDVDEELTSLGAAEVCAEAAEERRNTPPPVGVEDNIGPEGGSGQDDGAPMMTYQTQCWEEVERLVDAHLEDAGKELWGKAKDEGAFIEELGAPEPKGGKLLLEFSNGLVKLCELCGLLTRVSVAWTVSRLGEGEEERRLTSSWDRRGRRCRGRE